MLTALAMGGACADGLPDERVSGEASGGGGLQDGLLRLGATQAVVSGEIVEVGKSPSGNPYQRPVVIRDAELLWHEPIKYLALDGIVPVAIQPPELSEVEALVSVDLDVAEGERVVAFISRPYAESREPVGPWYVLHMVGEASGSLIDGSSEFAVDEYPRLLAPGEDDAVSALIELAQELSHMLNEQNAAAADPSISEPVSVDPAEVPRTMRVFGIANPHGTWP